MITTPIVRLYCAIVIALLAGGSVAAQPPATDNNPRPPCTAKSAACLQKIATLYLEALRKHDGSQLPLAPNIRRTENALTNARGPHQVRESFARTLMVEAVKEPRFIIDTRSSDIVVLFRLDIDLKPNQGADDTTTKAGGAEYRVAVTVPAGTYTVHEAERFRIRNGYITEIEIIAHVENGKGAGSGWPDERTDSVKPAQQ